MPSKVERTKPINVITNSKVFVSELSRPTGLPPFQRKLLH